MPVTDETQETSGFRQKTSRAPFETETARPHPLGATVDKEGVNFSVFSRNAISVELLLFVRQDDVQPIQIIKLVPPKHQTFFFWHVYVKGLKPGAHYAYRVDGPQDLDGIGFRFNRNKVLIDPYALGNTKALFNRDDAVGPADNLATSMRSVVIDLNDYDWEGDQPLRQPIQDLIIYEMHVAGFTRHSSSGVKHPGTFSGVIEKISYLKELGITAVELLPVMQSPYATTGSTALSVSSRPRATTAFLGSGRPVQHSRHPRRSFQPYQRREPPGTHVQLQGLWQRDLLPSRRAGPEVLQGLFGVR